MPRGWKKTKTGIRNLLRRAGTLVLSFFALVGEGVPKLALETLSGVGRLVLLPLRKVASVALWTLETLWSVCEAVLPFSKQDEEKRRSEKADEFWERYSYRIIRTFSLLGFFSFVTVAIVDIERLLELSYFLIFIAAAIAAAIATWRGRQFERQLRADRVTEALSMVTKEDEELRRLAGLDLLNDTRFDMSYRDRLRLRYLGLLALNIPEKRRQDFVDIAVDLHHLQSPEERRELFERVDKFIEKFPSSEILQSYFDLLKVGKLQSSDSAKLPYNNTWGSFWRTSIGSGGEYVILPYTKIEKVSYTLSVSEEEDFVVPSSKNLINQKVCFYYHCIIRASVMNYVDFTNSVICACNFENTKLNGANFTFASLYGTTFDENTSLEGAVFNHANITACKFESGDIKPKHLKDAFWIPLKDLGGKEMAPRFPDSWQQEDFWKENAYCGTRKKMVRDFKAFLQDIRLEPPSD